MGLITRMFTGADGKTHFEDLDLQQHPELLEKMKAESISFRVSRPGGAMNFHTAPRRQFVITLSGQGEIGLEDGTKMICGPGHVNLVEDTTGGGHTTRVVGDEPRVTVTIPLA